MGFYSCIPISIHSSPRVTRPTSVDMQIRKHPHKTTGGQPEARASVNHPPKEVVPISGPNRATGIPGVNAGILTPKQSQRPPFSEVQGSVTHRPAGHTSISIETLEAKDSDSISPSDPCDSLIKEKRYEWPSDYEHKLSTVTHVQFDALPPAKRSKIKQFMKTIKSRLTVQEVLSVITESTKITFDYVCLCILASILSAIGLMINSSVVIVASMLISPLMGPILAIVFAIVIHDVRLLRRGIRAELWGAAICLIIGSVIGSIDALLRVRHEMPVGYPTGEMCSRGQYMGLVSGIFIALPSGAGVAISVLGGNVGSLVGVAISASLLPPAVNCGVLYGYASVVAIVFKNVGIKANMTSEDCCLLTQAKLNETVGPLGLAALAAEAGTVSLLLTLLNVVCIIYMGFIVLKIKQVAPISTFTDTFWKEDVKTAKEYYKTIEREDAVQMRNQYLTYLREMISEPEGSDPNIEDNGVMYIPDDLNDLSKNINTISKNVFRYGPHKKSIVEEVLPDFDAEPTHEHRRTSSIRLVKFSDEIDGRTKSIGDRFQVVPVPDFKVKEP
ncbi:hypothetical protein ACOME3_009343 [Neoechinorhynchus agilis]